MSLEAEVPEGWTQRRLGECADQRTDKILPDAADTRRYVALEHLAQGRPMILGWFPAGRAISAKTVFHKGDLLFGKLRPNLRKAASAPFDGLCSTDILPIFGKGDLEAPYLLQLAQSDDFCQYAIATASGTKMPRTSWKQLAEFVVKLPPLAEQRKIAAVLSSVDGAIEKTQAVIDQVQVVKRGLMSELLTRGRRDGICGKRRRTKVGRVLENWEAVTLGDIATVVGGGTPSRSQPNYWNGDIPWATPTDVTRLSGRVISKTASAITNSGLANSSATLLPANSLLVTTRATIGACAISRISMATNQGFQNLVPKKGVCVEFLYYLIQYHTRNLERLGAGSTYLEIPKRVFSKFAVYLPPLTEQRRIAAILSSLDDTIQFELEAADRYKAVKRSLMSVLLTGELRVTPDPQAA